MATILKSTSIADDGTLEVEEAGFPVRRYSIARNPSDIPGEYVVWAIGRHRPHGYIPLGKPCEGHGIDTDSLYALRVTYEDLAEQVMNKAVSEGCTRDEMMKMLGYGPNLHGDPGNWEQDGPTEWSAYYFADPTDLDPDFVVMVEQSENGTWRGEIEADYVNGNTRRCEGFATVHEAMEWCDSWYPTDEQWEEYSPNASRQEL